MVGEAEAGEHERHVQRLTEARRRRERLRDALVELEEALSAAAGRSGAWGERTAGALSSFRAALAEHVTHTEADGGVFAEVLREAPHLRSAVERLRAEHRELDEGASTLAERCLVDPLDAADVDGLRDEGMELLGLATRHRQRGADLLYTAYEVDIAAGD